MKLSYAWSLTLMILAGVLIAIIADLSKDIFIIGNVLDDIAGALLISGSIGIIDKYILHNQLINLVIGKVNLKKTIDITGMTEVHLGWRDLPYAKLFATTKYNIDVVHAYASTWTNLYADDFVNLLKTKEINIRIVLLDPDSDEIISTYARQYNRTPEELKAQIKGVLRKWKNIYERSGIQDKNRLQLYVQNGVQTMALYRFDNTVISTSLPISKIQSGAYKLPSFICENHEQKTDLFRVYTQEIEDVINEARKLDIDNIA